MDRTEIERWLDQHHDSIHLPANDVLDRCETDVRHHARELAWQHARHVVESCLHRYQRSFGLPASEGFVAREVCPEIARELRHHEPHPAHPIPESEWLDARTLAALETDARTMVAEWLDSLADRAEHQAWLEIVTFTDHFAETLIRRAHMTGELSWDFDRSYPKLAARICELILAEFDARLRRESARGSDSRPLH